MHRWWAILLVPMAVLAAAPTLRDLNGNLLNLFKPLGAANILFFISSDCPISNGYAPEIQKLVANTKPKAFAALYCTKTSE